MVIFLDFLIKKWLLIECILHFHFVSKFPNFLPTLAIHQNKMLKLSLPITYYRAAALLKLFIGNSQISIHGRRGGGEWGSSPSGIAPLPHSNFEHPWSGNFLILMTFPPSPPPSLEKIFFPVLIPPLQKISGSLPYSPSLENFSSPSYSPLCRKFFTPCPIPPSLNFPSFPVLIPPLQKIKNKNQLKNGQKLMKK